MNHPLVSIITPTYNHARYIGACIDSVLAQTYENWEMIIVDDGSTDRTAEIAQGYAEMDPRIRSFRQENKGIWRLAETYNFALEQAHGEIIAVLEGDDLWPEEKLSTQVPAHLSGNFSLSFGQILPVNVSGAFLSKRAYPDPKRNPVLLNQNPRELFVALLRGQYNVPAVTILMSRGALDRAGGFQQPHYLPVVDYPTCLAVGAQECGPVFIPQVLGYWRRHAGQATSVYSKGMFFGLYRFAWEFAERADLRLGIPPEGLGQYLMMGQERRRFLGGSATYQEALQAFEDRDYPNAWHLYKDLGRSAIGFLFLYFECLAVFAWKYARRLSKKGQAVAQPVGARKDY